MAEDAAGINVPGGAGRSRVTVADVRVDPTEGGMGLPPGVVCPLLFDWYLWIGLVLSPGRPGSGMEGEGFGLPARSLVRSGYTVGPSTNAIGITR